jgi:hypothetical protein
VQGRHRSCNRLVRVWCAMKALATGQVVEAGEYHTHDLK